MLQRYIFLSFYKELTWLIIVNNIKAPPKCAGLFLCLVVDDRDATLYVFVLIGHYAFEVGRQIFG